MEIKNQGRIPNHVHTTIVFLDEKEKENKSEIEQRVISLLLTNQILRSIVTLDREHNKWKWTIMGTEYWKSVGSIERHIHIVENVKLETERLVREFLGNNCFSSLDPNIPQWQLWIVYPVLENQYMIIFQHHDWWFSKQQAESKIWQQVLPSVFPEMKNNDKTLTVSPVAMPGQDNIFVPFWLDMMIENFSVARVAQALSQSVCEYKQISTSVLVGINRKYVVLIDPFQSTLESIDKNVREMDTTDLISIDMEMDLRNKTDVNVENYLQFTTVRTKNTMESSVLVNIVQFSPEFKRICVLLDKTIFQDVKKFALLLESKIEYNKKAS